MSRVIAVCVLWPVLAGAETPHLTVEGGLPSGTASELRPLAWNGAIEAFLIERVDKRPSGSERTWNFYSRSLELLGYAVLTTDAGVSTENVQWMTGGTAAQKGALADLATKAREKLVAEPKAVDKLWADWQKLKPTACPVKMVKNELVADGAAAAIIDAPLSPADEKRGCSAPRAGALKCLAGADGDVVVVVPFKQDCNVSQQLLVHYHARNVEYLKLAQRGEAALKKGDLVSARKLLDASLKLEPKHAPAHFAHACVQARTGVSFRDGRAELEQILGSEDERQTWLPRIKSDASLQSWRGDPEFEKWILQFPTRTPIR
jgi:hypothetical protein